MTEINIFDFIHTQTTIVAKVCVEFKLNHANWEAEVEVTRTEEENYLDYDFKILNKESLPSMTESEEKELLERIEAYVETKRVAGEI